MKYTMNDFIDRCIAVRVRNEQERDAFLKMCEAQGLRWRRGAYPTEYTPPNVYGDDLCISCDFAKQDENELSYGDSKLYRTVGWTVVNFSDIVKRETKSNDFCIVISCLDGKTTVAELCKTDKDGRVKTVKTVEAKCNPADKFNLRIGAQTAFDRLWERSAE